MSDLRAEWATTSAWIHAIVMTVLILVRPLIWDGALGPDELAYHGLVLFGVLVLIIDAWTGIRRTYRFGLGGVLAILLALALIPALLRSPLPSAGFALWDSLAMSIGLALYLAQVIPGRERLALAALIAGLSGEMLFSAGQWAWVLPDFAERHQQGDPTFAMMDDPNGDLAARIAHGGLFGTFLLSNMLAAYVLLTAPLAISAWWRSPSQPRRSLLLIVVISTCVLIFIGTGSKGAMVAAMLAAAIVISASLRGFNRLVPWIVVGGAALLVLLVPTLRNGLAQSAEVRLGYWQGAVTLIEESPLTGHGLRSFSLRGAAAMPLSAEPAQHIHNEVLEAAVDGGVIAAALLAMILIVFALRARPLELPASDGGSKREKLAPIIAALAIPYLHLMGMLDFSSWPAGKSFFGGLLWSALFAAVLAFCMRTTVTLATPPRWALRFALVAFALHCCVDFDLHSAAIMATLATVAVMSSGGGRERALRTYQIVGASAALLIAIGVFGLWVQRANELRNGREIFSIARTAQLSVKNHLTGAAENFGDLAYVLGEPDPGIAIMGDPGAQQRLFELARGRVHQIATKPRWRDAEMEISSLSMWPAGAARLLLSRDAIARNPLSTAARMRGAEDAAAAGNLAQAVTWQREAIRLAPPAIRLRAQLAHYLRKMAAADSQNKEALLREANEVEAEAKLLTPQVYYRNRQ
jgi:hypothetical protein